MAGRPRLSTTIVNTFTNVMEENYEYGPLFNDLQDPLCVLKWLASRHLIANSFNCVGCGNLCSLSKYKQGVDKYRWNCSQCNLSKSVRHNSFFTGSHCTLQHLVMIIYMWSYRYPSRLIVSELKLDKETVVDWRNFIRDLTIQWKETYASKLGGYDENIEPRIVEIDESAFGKLC
jgi:hypothetical protein